MIGTHGQRVSGELKDKVASSADTVEGVRGLDGNVLVGSADGQKSADSIGSGCGSSNLVFQGSAGRDGRAHTVRGKSVRSGLPL